MGLHFVLILIVLAAYWGFTDASLIYPAVLATASAFYTVVISGARAPPPDTGLIMSVLWALIFSAAVCTIGYVIGSGIARLAN
jgi:hypothetical protein